ncbi:DUF397 domain-containing protein [Saccharopolyspora sp. NFXS83]|uniref:DUF397 domain-containing protein n=1 Tax=Saccharopolyspora sp. NFXS83 TaxID=2993560 RepID=UPI00224A6CAD|nr:DUF397 domain-containing protein [Saccharopolyspora sp. NFXS83]MCX2733226.1 DUF397 domain-containing protein [Saccharopolyspora sp. NFXS83]
MTAGLVDWRTSSYSGPQGNCVEVGWRKSSYSAANGSCLEVNFRKSTRSAGQGNCVEVGFKKSSYSGQAGSCVEVGGSPEVVGVRDTKDRDGGMLVFERQAWRRFIRSLRG